MGSLLDCKACINSSVAPEFPGKPPTTWPWVLQACRDSPPPHLRAAIRPKAHLELLRTKEMWLENRISLVSPRKEREERMRADEHLGLEFKATVSASGLPLPPAAFHSSSPEKSSPPQWQRKPSSIWGKKPRRWLPGGCNCAHYCHLHFITRLPQMPHYCWRGFCLGKVC